MLPDCNTNSLQAAIEHHVAGRLAEAEALYRQILVVEPDQAEALHMLGVLAYQVGNCEQGAALVERAILLRPDAFKYHSHLGMILVALNRLEDAVASYRRALQLNPGMPDILNNLAVALQLQGDHAGAIAAYQEALHTQPDCAQAASNLGALYRSVGRFAAEAAVCRAALAHQPRDADLAFQLGNALCTSGSMQETGVQKIVLQETLLAEAVAAFRQATFLRPDWAAAHNNLGVALKQSEDSDNAMACFRQAISLQPDFAAAHFNLGEALFQCGRLPQALVAYRAALALEPDSPQTHNNVGITLGELGEVEAAIVSLRRALELRPDYAEAYSNLGNALKAAGRVHEAIPAYRAAITLRPDDAVARNNLGCALISQGEADAALALLQEALALRPDFAEAHDNLGNALKARGEIDAALASYASALALRPDCQDTYSNRLYTLNFQSGGTRATLYQEHKEWNAVYAVPLRPRKAVYSNDRSPYRRLRIGYVAPDFREHCQSLFTLPLFAHHDHRAFEVLAYSNVAAPDAVTAQVRGCCDGWRNIVGLTDEAAADLIRQDQVDILVDLTLHMARNRLLVFARKPAPIQVTWLGYPGTTGLTAMDYRLTDPYLDPPNTESEEMFGNEEEKKEGAKDDKKKKGIDAFYSETSIRLPDTFWCYDPRTAEPAVNALPALQNGYLTFGCLNNFCKVTETTLQLWATVLRAIPTSRLLLLAPPGTARTRVLTILNQNGVAGHRVEFVAHQPRSCYLESYHRVDVGLDTIPYNGHTTSLDSFWMGVPVITLVGETAAGRAGWSQLNNLGLQSLAATRAVDFVEITRQVGADMEGLARLRHCLRARLQQSPLMDAPRFARSIEAAYQQMWKTWTIGTGD